MSAVEFIVTVASGTLQSQSSIVFPHQWTDGGVSVAAAFTGGHLFHLAPAGCILNDVHREAVGMDVDIDGVRVRCWGSLDTDTWQSTGVTYEVEIDSTATAAQVEAVLARVDSVAEIPKTMRSPTQIARRAAN